MKPKDNLNNVQRKMLDSIYTEQFDKQERVILNRRTEGLEQLKLKVAKQESSSPQLKKLLKAGVEFHQYLQAAKQYLDENGLSITSTIREVPRLEVMASSYGYRPKQHPELRAYLDETDQIIIKLGEKKKEMRARIFGSNVSYAEAEKEINAILADVA